MIDSDTIIALCTARASGALALIRLSGPAALSIADTIVKVSSGISLQNAATHTVHHGFIVDAGNNHERIDEVLCMVMHAPRTFTGEHTVEITTHNNPFIIERVISCGIAAGARQARAGEFSERAYLNGKLDLLQVEGLNELIHAHTEQATRAALAQLHGSLSREMGGIEEALVQLLCFTEASFEFLDEEQRDVDFDALVRERVALLRARVAELIRHFNQQDALRGGLRVALIGSVNAGKSTLLNSLAGYERAIVSSEAGTTRDTIELTISRGGTTFTLIDTAGIRETEHAIERAGIERSLSEARAADVRILVLDATRGVEQLDVSMRSQLAEQSTQDTPIVVLTKADVANKWYSEELLCFARTIGGRDPLIVSAETRQGIDLLEREIIVQVRKQSSSGTASFIITARQHAILLELDHILGIVQTYCTQSLTYELIAHHLRDALCRMSELTGKGASEKMLDTVFRSFCIGK